MSGGATSWGVASFLGTWIAMTAAMMLPSLVPALWRYRRQLGSISGTRASRLTLVAGTGYFLTWALFGLAIHPFGIALESAVKALPELRRAVPAAAGLLVLFAGALQFTAWKARRLTRCREAASPECMVGWDASAAWRHGLRLGWHCGLSCAGPMASLLAIGMMDLRAMAVVTVAITLERLAPAGRLVARGIGVGGVAAGVLMVARAAGWLATRS